jgi:hypothetical protein
MSSSPFISLDSLYGDGNNLYPSGSFSLEQTLTSPISGSVDRALVARIEERGIELDPLVRFENQVVSHWLPKVFSDDIEKTIGLYHSMKAEGRLTIEEYSAQRLATMYTHGKIEWCEASIDQHKIDGIVFPMNPEKDLLAENVGGPVIFVGNWLDKDRVSVMQGNHRTAAVLFRGQESDESLYVLRFRTVGDCQKLMGTTPSRTYRNPIIPEKFSHTFIGGGSYGRA